MQMCLAFSSRAAAGWAVASAALLAGCDSPGTVTVRAEDGDGVAIVASEDGRTLTATGDGVTATVADALPAFAPAYPGARIVSRVTSLPMGGGARGSVTVMEADAPLGEVAAFYDQAARRAGIAPSTRVDSPGRAVRIYQGHGDGDRSTVVAMDRPNGAEVTRVVVTTEAEDPGGKAPRVAAVDAPAGAAAASGDRTAERRAPVSDVRLQ